MKKWLPYATPPAPGTPGWLDWFDVIVWQSSGGKDSLDSGIVATAELEAAGVMHKTAGLHLWLDRRHDLDDADASRVEWPLVPALAAEQARRLGLPLGDEQGWQVWDARRDRRTIDRADWAGRFHFARRSNHPDRSDWDGDLLDDVATRLKRDGTARGWPSKWTRYCTSDWKTAVGRAFVEYLCEQVRREQGLTRPVRVLQIMGFRAEESTDRAERPVFGLNYGVSAQYSRWTWEWLPIHDRTVGQVWDSIRHWGIPYHPVYDVDDQGGAGMSRLSCRGCIMASLADLATMRRRAPGTAADIIGIERKLGDPFRGADSRTLESIAPTAGRAGFAVRWETCPTGSVPVLAADWEARRWCPTRAVTGPWNEHTRSVAGCAAAWATA